MRTLCKKGVFDFLIVGKVLDVAMHHLVSNKLKWGFSSSISYIWIYSLFKEYVDLVYIAKF